MIVIADSGSSNCSWALCDLKGNVLQEFKTIGFNPYFINPQDIIKHLENSHLKKYKSEIKNVFFYGAGCSTTKQKSIIKKPLIIFFNNAKINIGDDLEAACFASSNKQPNITCILGTGSNSCFYDGKKIIENKPSLGFILDDIASGNYFGKKIIKYYFNNILTKELEKKLKKDYVTNIIEIRNNIYNNRTANIFLSKYFPFIVENKNHPIINNLIHNTLNKFIIYNIKYYKNYKKVKINFTGSVAFYLSKEIKLALKNHNLRIGEVTKNPIKGLANFHKTILVK